MHIMHILHHFCLVFLLGIPTALSEFPGPGENDTVFSIGPCSFSPGPGWTLNATSVTNVYKTQPDTEWDELDLIHIDRNTSALFIFDIPNSLAYQYCGFKFVFPKIEGGCRDYYVESEWETIQYSKDPDRDIMSLFDFESNCRNDTAHRKGPFDIFELDQSEEINGNVTWSELQHLKWQIISDDVDGRELMRESKQDAVIIQRLCSPGKKAFRMDGVWNGSLTYFRHGATTVDKDFKWGRPPVGAYIVPCWIGY